MARSKTPTRRPSQGAGPARQAEAAPLPPPSPDEAIAQALHAAATPEAADPLLSMHNAPAPGDSGAGLEVSGSALRAGLDEHPVAVPLTVRPDTPAASPETTEPALAEVAEAVAPEIVAPSQTVEAPLVTAEAGPARQQSAGSPFPIFELQRSIFDFYQQSAVAGLSFWTSFLSATAEGKTPARDQEQTRAGFGTRKAA